MLKTFIIIIVVGLIILLAGYFYNRLMTAETFQTVHKWHAEEPKEPRNPGALLMWLGGSLAMLGGAGVVHVFLRAADEETKEDDET